MDDENPDESKSFIHKVNDSSSSSGLMAMRPSDLSEDKPFSNRMANQKQIS